MNATTALRFNEVQDDLDRLRGNAHAAPGMDAEAHRAAVRALETERRSILVSATRYDLSPSPNPPCGAVAYVYRVSPREGQCVYVTTYDEADALAISGVVGEGATVHRMSGVETMHIEDDTLPRRRIISPLVEARAFAAEGFAGLLDL